MAPLLRRGLPMLLVGLACTVSLPRAAACEFCSMQGQTLIDEVTTASMVLYGSLANSKLDANGALGQGTTDLQIEAVIKKHPVLKDRKVLVLPRYLPSEGNQTKYLIFCDVLTGKIDPYRGVPVKQGSDIVKYLTGAQAVRKSDIATRLRYYFDYLDDGDVEISNDAYKAFANADEKDYQQMAHNLPAAKIAKWLADPETPPFRYGLYASMLGHCGAAKDADVIRRMLDDPQKRLGAGVDGMLAGYTMLKPAEGWSYVRGILADPKLEFGLRYAALRTARFFYAKRPDVIDQKKAIEAVSLLIDDPNIADLAIDDLRKWKCWDRCDRVLGLAGKPTHSVAIIRRSILKYALDCPEPKAAAFVAGLRKKDPELVNETEELLKLEAGTLSAKPAAGK
jgi:hypothetical protein